MSPYVLMAMIAALEAAIAILTVLAVIWPFRAALGPVGDG